MSISKIKTIFITTLFFASMLIVSCSDSGKSASQENKVNQADTATANPVNSKSISLNQGNLDNNKNSKKPINSASNEKISVKNNQSKEIENNNPIFGTIKDMQNGDLKCYVAVLDENGKLHESVGAVFEVCEPDKYVNKKVKMYYSLENVNDCQSSEPCGKTIEEWLISKIEIQDE